MKKRIWKLFKIFKSNHLNFEIKSNNLLSEQSIMPLLQISSRIRLREQSIMPLLQISSRIQLRAKYNERQLKLVTEKRIDSKEKMRHNLAELERYRTMRGELKSVILKYLFEIAEGPTFFCSCCGCLHYRKTVVILKREKLVSTIVCKHDFVKQVIILYSI